MPESSSNRVEDTTAIHKSQDVTITKPDASPKSRRRSCRILCGLVLICSLSPIWEDAEIQRSFASSTMMDRTPNLSTVTSKQSLGTSYAIGSDYFFWSGTSDICTLIRNMTAVDILGEEEPAYVAAMEPPPIVNLTVDCEALSGHTGNWITAIYHLRLAAALGRVDFQFQCSTGMASVETSMLPWFSGYYPAPSNETWPYDLGRPDGNLVCSKKYSRLPLQHLASEMQRDMRRIAVAMLGPREKVVDATDLNLASLAESVPDEFLNRKEIEIDDAAIHFRCGDVFGYTTKTQYGVIQFREYVKRIPKATTKTIGIHTQPFDVSLLRNYDKDAADTCKVVIGIMVNYLQHEYPNATITVRNTQNDTIPLTYARLAMGAQTMTSTSTFGIFPAIGTFGEGFFQPNAKLNKFAANISESVLPNVHTIDGPMMSSPEIAKKGLERTIKFLTERP
mmetsp:Transcript_3105/g.4487  ORF Transcript_3105/g.4487 Transcript_3105/m.4487 type:complete len:450 (-) Transcript_3105:260-1609(-)